MLCLDFDGDTSIASKDPILVNADENLPALLDLSWHEGEYVEGCPWQPTVKAEYDFFGHKYTSDVIVDGNQFNDGFVVTFTDEDYTPAFARQLHELSKIFVLRSLEKNLVGQLTNYASQILAAISRLEWCLANNVDVNGLTLADSIRVAYKMEIAMMEVQVDKLRLAQGYEIDRPKHGGAFWEHFNLDFITKPEAFPTYATETVTFSNGTTTTRFMKLEWMKAVKSNNSFALQEDGAVLPSMVQGIRSHVLFSYISKIKARFNGMNASMDKNNLIYRLAPHANVHSHALVDDVLKMLTPIFAEYGKGQLAIGTYRKMREEKRVAYYNYVKGNKISMDIYDLQTKQKVDVMMSEVIENARAEVLALPFDQETIAYIAYAKKYNNYNPEKVSSPAEGLSFPWIVCQEGMLSLVNRASGHTALHSTFEPIAPAKSKVRMILFNQDPAYVSAKFAAAKRIAVWYQFDADTNVYMPFVYVNNECVGVITSESAYYFTGSDKFVFNFSDFALTKSGKSASVLVDAIERR